MAKMHETSQALAYMTKPGTWEPIGDWTQEEIYAEQREATSELWHSPLGIALEERGGPDIRNRVMETFAERCPAPSIVPFFETLRDVMQDIVVDLPLAAETAAPSLPEIPAIAPPAPLTAEDLKLKADRESEVRKFAYMVNRQLNRNPTAAGEPFLPCGVASLKPRGGVVTVAVDASHSYDYPSAKFEELWDEATKLGVLR